MTQSASVLRAATLSRLLLTIGTLPLLRGAQFIIYWIVHQGGDDLALALQRDCYGKERNAVQEVGGAVERVYNPAVGLVVALDHAPLLHQETVTGAGLRQFPEQRLLAPMVGAGGKIGRAFD